MSDCKRDGCPRRIKGSSRHEYCHMMCRQLDRELSRLQELYAAAGDPTLDKSAWVALVEVADKWSEYERARGTLVKQIRASDLPFPA